MGMDGFSLATVLKGQELASASDSLQLKYNYWLRGTSFLLLAPQVLCKRV